MNEMIYEMNHILEYEIKRSYDPRSYERSFSNYIEKPGKKNCEGHDFT